MDAHVMIHTALQTFKVAHPGLSGIELLKQIKDQPACSVCSEIAHSPKRCAACKAVIYCSVACQKKAWKNPHQFSSGKTHKFLCPLFKRHMTRCDDMQAILEFFPWGFVCGADRSFPVDWFLASRNLLGSIGFGYWSERPMISAHDAGGAGNSVLESIDETVRRNSSYINGYMLLERDHLLPRKGWVNLPDAEIPFYHDFKAHPLPERLDDLLESWEDWHTWRKIPKSSVVSLIMHQVMSVYFMLTNSLNFFPLLPESPRQKVRFDLVGVERELNIIPLFAELALLLPGYEFEATFWGPAVHALGLQATVRRDCLVKTAGNGPIFTYTAPKELGGSTIKITLATKHKSWEPPTDDEEGLDCVLALNSGMGSYQNEWWPCVQRTLVMGVPFISTDYQESFLEVGVSYFANVVREKTLEAYQAEMPLPSEDREIYERLLKKGEGKWEWEWNPFQRPGKKGEPLPNTANGFVFEFRI